MDKNEALLFSGRKLYKQQTACAVYGYGSLTEIVVGKWSPTFRSGHFDLKVSERSAMHSVIDNDQIETVIQSNPDHTTRNIAEIIHITNMSILTHLKNTWICESLQNWGESRFSGKKQQAAFPSVCSNSTKTTYFLKGRAQVKKHKLFAKLFKEKGNEKSVTTQKFNLNTKKILFKWGE